MKRNILKALFLFIIPFALIFHIATLGNWTVQMKDPTDGKIYQSDDVSGFPFPSYGHFMPVVHPASSDWEYCASATNMLLNWIIAFSLGTIFYFPLRKISIRTELRTLLLVFSYATIPFILCFFFFKTQGWWSDYTVVHYHLWYVL